MFLLPVRVTALSLFIFSTILLSGCDQDPAFDTRSLEQSDETLAGNDADQLPNNIDTDGDGIADRYCAKNDEKCYKDAGVEWPGAGDSRRPNNSTTNGGEKTVAYVSRTDTFTQPATGKADVLWIVDSSFSMDDEQRMLSANFPMFANKLATLNVDVQTAVTSTDVCDTSLPADKSKVVCPSGNGTSAYHLRGKFRGAKGSQILSEANNGAQFASVFTNYAKVGTGGSGFEHGLWAAKLAIDLENDGTNDRLRRSDSFLSIIVVSDEEDDGIGLAMTNEQGDNYHAAGYTTFSWNHIQMKAFLDEKVGAGKYSISAITGTKDADGKLCKSDHSSPLEEGTQYIAAAAATGGKAVSICNNNWDVLLSDLGKDIGQQAMQFVLKKKAKEGSIDVFIDGVLVDNGWTYVASANAVRFTEKTAPPPGAEVTIKYLTVK